MVEPVSPTSLGSLQVKMSILLQLRLVDFFKVHIFIYFHDFTKILTTLLLIIVFIFDFTEIFINNFCYFFPALREQVVSLKNLTYFVLDEADRMLDMGFGPDIDEVVKDPSMPPKFRRHTLLFSATFPDKIQEAASTYLKEDYLFLKVGTVGSACKDVRQTIYEVKKFEKREKLMTLLQESQEDQSGKTEKTLVFVETKQNADFLALYLSSEVSLIKS